MTDQKIEMLPCPFCGSEKIDPMGWASKVATGPRCDDCGASAESVAIWNNRVKPHLRPVYNTLAFFSSCIKSGESWTSACGDDLQRAYDALNVVYNGASSAVKNPGDVRSPGNETDWQAKYEALVLAASKENDEICQLLAEALGYPRFFDDQEAFPGAKVEDGYFVGEHVAVTLAMEVRSYCEKARIGELLRMLASERRATHRQLSLAMRSRSYKIQTERLLNVSRSREQELLLALDAALAILGEREPGDSRAVSDEFVALAHIRSYAENNEESKRILADMMRKIEKRQEDNGKA